MTLQRAVELLAAKVAKVEAKAAKAAASSAAPGGIAAASKKSAASPVASKAGTGQKPTRASASKGGRGVKLESSDKQSSKERGNTGSTGRKTSKPCSPAAGAGELAQNGRAEQAAREAAGSSKQRNGPNAYMHWKRQRWPALKAEHPDKSFTELMKLTSEEWTNLEPALKLRFKHEAAAQRTQPITN